MSTKLVQDFERHVGKGFGSGWQGLLVFPSQIELSTVLHNLNMGKGVFVSYSLQSITYSGAEQLKLVSVPPNTGLYTTFHGYQFQWIGVDGFDRVDSDFIEKIGSTLRSKDFRIFQNIRMVGTK